MVLTATDAQLLDCLDQDRDRLAIVRFAAEMAAADQAESEAETVELAPYVA
ncbi:hypothetical protein ES708_28984 [subsurface metagenome]